jgi:hypothetical protein
MPTPRREFGKRRGAKQLDFGVRKAECGMWNAEFKGTIKIYHRESQKNTEIINISL